MVSRGQMAPCHFGFVYVAGDQRFVRPHDELPEVVGTERGMHAEPAVPAGDSDTGGGRWPGRDRCLDRRVGFQLHAELALVPHLHSGFVGDVDAYSEASEQRDRGGFGRLLRFFAEVFGVEVDEVVVGDVSSRGPAVSAVPYRLGDSSRSEVPVRQPERRGAVEYRGADRVGSQNGLQVAVVHSVNYASASASRS